MAKTTKLGWTDATWNFVTGCLKVSAGCKFCYAKRDWARLAKNEKSVYFGREFEDVAFHEDRLRLPLMWTKPRLIFVNSMSDLFINEVNDDMIDRAMAIMMKAKWHVYQILTKRSERMAEYFNGNWKERIGVSGEDCSHIWVGVTAENQESADKRMPDLVSIEGMNKFVSMEPLLDLVTMDKWLADIGWVIVGGESGDTARPMPPEAARIAIKECEVAGLPVMFKQWGEWAPEIDANGTERMKLVGRWEAGCAIDNIEHKAFPEQMMVGG